MVKRKHPPKFLSHVLRAIAFLNGHQQGASVRHILQYMKKEYSEDKTSLVVEVRKALKYAMDVGALKKKSGGYIIGKHKRIMPVDSLEIAMDCRSKKRKKTRKRNTRVTKCKHDRCAKKSVLKKTKTKSVARNNRKKKQKKLRFAEHVEVIEPASRQDLKVNGPQAPLNPNNDDEEFQDPPDKEMPAPVGPQKKKENLDRKRKLKHAYERHQTQYPEYNDTMTGDDRKQLSRCKGRCRRYKRPVLPSETPVCNPNGDDDKKETRETEESTANESVSMATNEESTSDSNQVQSADQSQPMEISDEDASIREDQSTREDPSTNANPCTNEDQTTTDDQSPTENQPETTELDSITHNQTDFRKVTKSTKHPTKEKRPIIKFIPIINPNPLVPIKRNPPILRPIPTPKKVDKRRSKSRRSKNHTDKKNNQKAKRLNRVRGGKIDKTNRLRCLKSRERIFEKQFHKLNVFVVQDGKIQGDVHDNCRKTKRKSRSRKSKTKNRKKSAGTNTDNSSDEDDKTDVSCSTRSNSGSRSRCDSSRGRKSDNESDKECDAIIILP